MAKLDGSCLCGSITYACDADPMAIGICHCTECQKQTGTAFSVVVVVPRDALAISGDTLAEIVTIGTESNMPLQRRFCRNCGSPIVSLPEAEPEIAVIKAGTLEDRSWLDPQFEIWCESALPWSTPDEIERARFQRGAPAA
jgi:hypothetical protein